jgi:hypothetical protein
LSGGRIAEWGIRFSAFESGRKWLSST